MTKKDKKPNLVEEQAELITLMETSMDPNLLEAVEQAYRTPDDVDEASSMEISFDGTKSR